MKKLIAFDLDDTLAVTKSPMEDRMAAALTQLLDYFEVCVISGGKFEQFKKQVIDRLTASPEQLEHLHIMPTCGTRYYHFDIAKGDWQQVYSEDLSEEQKRQIIVILEKSAKQLGFWEEETHGDIIEDRGSQITYSALGQEAPPEAKYKWDPDGKKKHAIRELASKELPDVEVRVGGTTSVDVTMVGIDKAYGMRKLMEQLEIGKETILFIGDKLEEGGNDYPVKAMGIDCLEISEWQETALAVEAILHVV